MSWRTNSVAPTSIRQLRRQTLRGEPETLLDAVSAAARLQQPTNLDNIVVARKREPRICVRACPFLANTGSTLSNIAQSARKTRRPMLIAECRHLGANLLVMGSYGHSQLHDLLPGSTTSRILRRSPAPCS